MFQNLAKSHQCLILGLSGARRLGFGERKVFWQTTSETQSNHCDTVTHRILIFEEKVFLDPGLCVLIIVR